MIVVAFVAGAAITIALAVKFWGATPPVAQGQLEASARVAPVTSAGNEPMGAATGDLAPVPKIELDVPVFSRTGVAPTTGPLVPAAWRSVQGVTVPPPPRELRGAWVATVANIDWPSKPGLPKDQQVEEIRKIIDSAKAAGLNALFLQIRPSCDSMYPSQLEPWSEFLTGVSGVGPGYDPLATWIELSHAQAIELHAWFNPFRSRHFEAKGPDAANHVNNTMPDIVHQYDVYKWMDPGSKKGQAWALEVVGDVLARYDIDGVHLDDYFYPYPKDKKPFPDSATYGAYTKGGGELTLGDWRRERINTFVANLYATCKQIRPYAKVGISPFGIWRPGHPKGVEGFDAYDNLYADALAWLKARTLDYCSPQLYWAIDAPKQPYGPLLDWWVAQAGGISVIPGIYSSRLDPAVKKWTADEIVNQVMLTRGREGTGGVIHFSMKAVQKSYNGLAERLAQSVYAEPALVPEFTTCPAPVPVLEGLAVLPGADGAVEVRWTGPGQSCRVVAVGWRRAGGGGVWDWDFVAAGNSGETKGSTRRGGNNSYDAVAVAPVSRGGTLGAWVVLGP